MEEKFVPEIHGYLRKFMLTVPKVISEASGIRIFGKRIKSLVFSTDVSIIRNCNADAVIAVYPFTPQPVITQAVIMAADVPVFVGIGGGLTQGIRVLDLGLHAEFQGAIGVVVNAPTSNSTVKQLKEDLDIPIVVTVASEKEDIAARLEAGAQILNVSAAAKTPELVRKIREQFPKVPIIATGGPTDETILETIRAGANAITWTPPSSGEVFKDIMEAYRRQEGHPPF
ncbi:MAG: hydrolase [Clostridiales bacterium]|nr:hydrolase [Clostridiales bacterium]